MDARWTIRVLVAGLAMAGHTAAAAGSPSFDCDRATSAVERLICGDDELADLDVQVAKAYANRLAKVPASRVNELKGGQAEWRKALLGCGKSSDARACTVAAYQLRLSEL